MQKLVPILLLVAIGAASCAADTRSAAESDLDTRLGPVDGRDLPGTDLERVRVGDLAPDFALASLDGPTVTLSEFRDNRNVILVFYRGYW
jgi:hypothetical protein